MSSVLDRPDMFIAAIKYGLIDETNLLDYNFERPAPPRPRRLVDWPKNMTWLERCRYVERCAASGCHATLRRRHIIEVATGRELPIPRRRYPRKKKR